MSGGVDDLFRHWLRSGLSGREFARLLAGKQGRVAIQLHPDRGPPSVDRLNNLFDEHAEGDRVAIAVFPRITSEPGLVDLLHALDANARWNVRRRANTSPEGGALVGLEWTTPSHEISEAMGFAPSLAMPVPRRAPYVALALWPGRRSNPFRGTGSTPSGRPGEVSFLDTSHGFDHDRYEAMWARTTTSVATLMSMPPDDPRLYRRAAFVLTTTQADKLSSTASNR